MKNILLVLVIGLAISACTSGQAPPAAVDLRHFPLDSLEGVRATTGASFDPKISTDGKGSLRVDAREPINIPLFELTDVGVENAALIYQASLQSENLDGKAFLEMWVRIPGKGGVLLPRAGSPHHGNHELDDCRDSLFPTGRTKAGSHSAQPDGTGKRTSLD